MNEHFKSLVGAYTQEDINILQQLNSFLTMDYFDSTVALQIGNQIVKETLPFGDVAIQIIRLKDDNVIFQYIGSAKSNRNLGFIERKINVVKEVGYSSLYGLVRYLVNGIGEELVEDSKYAPVSGAFPLFVNHEMVAVVGVSGLHEGKDYTCVITALEHYLNKKAPNFNGPLI